MGLRRRREGALVYVAVWYDEMDLSRAWGSATEKGYAELQADLEASAYLEERPDVRLVVRRTFELVEEDSATYVLIAERKAGE